MNLHSYVTLLEGKFKGKRMGNYANKNASKWQLLYMKIRYLGLMTRNM